MKILYTATDQDLGSFHGGTIHVLAVTAELLKYGHEVHLVIQKSLQPRSISDRIIIHEIARTNRYLLWKAGAQIQSLLEKLSRMLLWNATTILPVRRFYARRT